MSQPPKSQPAWANVWLWLGFLLVIASACRLLWQAYFWLREGHWPFLSTGDALFGNGQWPQMKWVGANRIYQWLLGVSVTPAMFFTGLGFLLLAAAGDAPPPKK